jgi:hypothetical protein
MGSILAVKIAEANSSGRLDRLEAVLDKMGEKLDKVAAMGCLHDERLARIETNFEQMQERKKRVDERIDNLGERVATLVSSIGDLIARIPPENLRR